MLSFTGGFEYLNIKQKFKEIKLFYKIYHNNNDDKNKKPYIIMVMDDNEWL